MLDDKQYMELGKGNRKGALDPAASRLLLGLPGMAQEIAFFTAARRLYLDQVRLPFGVKHKLLKTLDFA